MKRRKVSKDTTNINTETTEKENVMATKKNIKKSEVSKSKTVKQEPVEAKKEVKQEAAPKASKAAKPAPEAPEKALATPATEPEAPKAIQAAAPFATPCGGLFDADPSSSCFGMCKDESPEDFDLCMAHFKSAIEQKTTKRRAAATKTAKEKVKRERGESVPRAAKRYDRIGDGFGTSAHMINVLLLEGATLEEIMDVVPTERTRVMGHLSGLKSGNGKRAPKVVLKDPTTKRYYLEVEEGEPCTYFTII